MMYDLELVEIGTNISENYHQIFQEKPDVGVYCGRWSSLNLEMNCYAVYAHAHAQHLVFTCDGTFARFHWMCYMTDLRWHNDIHF